MGCPISTNLFRSISDSGENLTRGAEILDRKNLCEYVCIYFSGDTYLLTSGLFCLCSTAAKTVHIVKGIN